MPDRFSLHLERAAVTQAAIAEVGPVADLPAERVTAHDAMIDDVRAKQAAADAAHTLYIVKEAQNEALWRELWLKLRAWYAVAKVTGPAEARAGLSGIDTSLGFKPANVRKRAEQTRAALVGFPAEYTAAGLTAADLGSTITEMLAAEEAEDALRATWRNEDATLKAADTVLDKENKALYQVLRVSFLEGTPEWNVIQGIPTTPAYHGHDNDIVGPEG
ncbi:MAG: hypothetical protein GW911_30230 [Armatimonadetes bacterium]|nr:hypothetical protein [Armatimonadota bacterium]NCO90972.1 hypothetical protein [Armatimonadota bacterium]NCP30927.1 hypothetical protein [Armatimonadota bacterium]NCQ26386.1 hypothetical protein [Armatimonadota bacterium]NDK16328.1 hypothetical protein [Armatimonadota bacterium]